MWSSSSVDISAKPACKDVVNAAMTTLGHLFTPAQAVTLVPMAIINAIHSFLTTIAAAIASLFRFYVLVRPSCLLSRNHSEHTLAP